MKTAKANGSPRERAVKFLDSQDNQTTWVTKTMTGEPRENRFPPELVSQVLVDRSRYGSDQEFRAARAAAWAALASGGITLTEIAAAVGITRERVRQILRQEGYDVRKGSRGPRSPGPVEVLEIVRTTSTSSMNDLADRAKTGDSTVRMMLRELGLEPAVERLFRLRAREQTEAHTERTKGRIIAALKTFAESHGSTPGVNDAIMGALPFSHTTAVRYFGTWNNALRAAGLETRGVGESKKKVR